MERDGCLSNGEANPSLFQTLYRWFALLWPASLIWGHDIHTEPEDVHSLIQIFNLYDHVGHSGL